MKGQQFTVNSRKYDLSLRRSWTAHLLKRAEVGLLLEGYFEAEVSHHDLGLIRKGTRSVEVFLSGRWFNYFAFFEPTGEFRNYYINISMPPVIGAGVIDYVDLDIDVILWPEGRIEVLDLEEFEENALTYSYPMDVVDMAIETKEGIVQDPQRYINLFASSINSRR